MMALNLKMYDKSILNLKVFEENISYNLIWQENSLRSSGKEIINLLELFFIVCDGAILILRSVLLHVVFSMKCFIVV